jgi:hypothetical protein
VAQQKRFEPLARCNDIALGLLPGSHHVAKLLGLGRGDMHCR